MEICVANLAHRMIEFQLLDRSEQKILLALERCAGLVADHLWLPCLTGDERGQGIQSRKADQRCTKNAEAHKNQVSWGWYPDEEHRDGCAHERAEGEELPRAQ